MKYETGKTLNDYFIDVEIAAVLIKSIDLKVKMNRKYQKFYYSKKLNVFFDENLIIFKKFSDILKIT